MWLEREFLAGQHVTITCPALDLDGVCSVIDVDPDKETISVVTKYQDRGSRRHVQNVPWASVGDRGPRAPHGSDGVNQRAHGAMERLAGRFVEHGKTIGVPMGADEAYDRARTVAARNHGHGPPKAATRRVERDNG